MARQALGATLRHPDLLRLDLGIFALHAMLMASFVALPLALVEKAGLPKEAALVGVPDGAAGFFFAMIPFIIYGEKKRQMKRVLLGAVLVLMLTELFFWEFGRHAASAGHRYRGLLHRIQFARGVAAIADQQSVSGGREGHGDGDLFHQSVPGFGGGRDSRRVAFPARRTGCGVPWRRRAGRHLAGVCCYHARTSLRNQPSLAVVARGSTRHRPCRSRVGRTWSNRCSSGGR